MQANETKLQNIIEGTRQYVVPLFQRTYDWTKPQWQKLWEDLKELSQMEVPRTHFMGSIVTMPTTSVPEGVPKFLLIDGQQRLTTIFILLTLLRNKAIENGEEEFSREINDTLLVNPFKKDLDYFKLMPTQVDRSEYTLLIKNQMSHTDNRIFQAYDYFDKQLKQANFDKHLLKKIITTYFSIVSIVLDPEDNPHLVFESLNAKGRRLTEADLIRNYFFMRIHVNDQESIYETCWKPMQNMLGESLTEFIRHYLMKNGSLVKTSDIYDNLKDTVKEIAPVPYLQELASYATYYSKLLNPIKEESASIRKQLIRLNKIEVTTAYPFLLNLYRDYETNKTLSESDFAEILKTLENYLIRGFICNSSNKQLNKYFPSLYNQLKEKNSTDMVAGLKSILQTRNYPKDIEFKERLIQSKLYGAGDRRIKTELILKTLEEAFEHKEVVSLDGLSIEHIMPQTLTEKWHRDLGDDWEITHELSLHSLGNLTLTAYNPELSNSDYLTKKEFYTNSHIELNKYFNGINTWGKEDIEKRGELLAESALKIWPYFGTDSKEDQTSIEVVTGKTPSMLKILGQSFSVKSWRDVLGTTLSTIADLEPEKFELIAKNYPRYVGKDKSIFRDVRELNNGYYFEVNLSSQSIQRLCWQAIDTIELTTDDWEVELIADNEDDDGTNVTKDRVYWEEQNKHESLDVFDECTKILVGIDNQLSINYTQSYIGLAKGNKTTNFIKFIPKVNFLWVSVKVEMPEDWQFRLESSEIAVISIGKKTGRLKFRLVGNDIVKHSTLLSELFAASYNY